MKQKQSHMDLLTGNKLQFSPKQQTHLEPPKHTMIHNNRQMWCWHGAALYNLQSGRSVTFTTISFPFIKTHSNASTRSHTENPAKSKVWFMLAKLFLNRYKASTVVHKAISRSLKIYKKKGIMHLSMTHRYPDMRGQNSHIPKMLRSANDVKPNGECVLCTWNKKPIRENDPRYILLAVIQWKIRH